MNGKVYCNGTRIKCLQQMELTVGMVGAEVEFDFSEEWDGLGKLAVFRSDGSRDVIVDENGVAVVPHEILTTPGMDVEVGVYAVREDGTTWPAPTPFCKLTRNGIAEGVDPSGDESYPPTPEVGEQLQNQINSLGERVDKLEVGGGSGSGTGEAIVDVSELPTENINEDVLYRLTTGMVVFNGQNGRVFDNTAVYIVDSLPETGEPCSSDIGESTAIYYNTSKGAAYGYIDERASVSLMQPVGWKSASTAFAAMGYEYSGVVTSMNDIARSSAAVLLEHTLYHYKNGWERVAGDTPFFDLSNLGLEAVDLAGVADGVSVRVGIDTRAIINALARGAVKFGFQIIYNGATLDVEAVGSAMYLEAENTYQIHNFSVFADMPMTVTISVDELYVSVSVVAAQSGGGSIELDATEKSLLLSLFKNAAYTADMSATITQLETLWGGNEEPDEPATPDATLSSISATYSGGSVPVGTAVSSLTGVRVTAHYSDGSTVTVTGYTLSGTIKEGTNTITVSYGGKTTTFTVTGVADESGGDEPGGDTEVSGDEYVVVTGATATDDGNGNVTVTGLTATSDDNGNITAS